MSFLPRVDAFRTARYGIPLFILLIAAGLTGNYYPISILNLHFILGSVFAMLALQVFGLGWGILAAAIISSYTYLNWNHPYAIMTMTAEMMIAGWLFSRRKVALVMADTVYWIFIGIPMGFCCFYFIAHLPASNGLFLMMKQSINGIVNALIARLIFTGYALRSKSSTVSFRENLSNLLAFFALCSMLIMLISGSRTDLNETERQIREQLLRDSLRLTDSLNDWMRDRERLIEQLAIMAQTRTPAQMQTRLAEARASDRNFLRIALIDREGTVIAYSPPKDEVGRNNIGKSFADRPYIPLLKQTLKPMLSEVMSSRFGRTEPVTIMLAPVVSQGKYKGAVGGIMNFDRIDTIFRINLPGQSTLYTLLDKNGKVILTNRKDQKALAPFSRGKGTTQHINKTLFQWIPALPPNISTIELWGRSFYVAESTIGDLAEWRLILEQPVAPFQKMLYDRYSGKIVMMFLVLIMLLGIAALLSRRFTFTVEQLQKLTGGLPAKLASNQRINWPESGIQDIGHLIANFREMADSLQTRFKEIKEINESLERRIEERTHELQASKDKLSNAAEMARLGQWEYDVPKDLFTFNDQFYKIFRTTAEQAGGYTMSSAEYARRFVHPDDAPLVGEEIREAIETTDPGFSRQLEHRMLRADGTTGHISVRFFIVKDAEGRTVKTYGVNQDISERKKADEEKKQLESQIRHSQKMEAISNLAGGIAHDFNNILSGIMGYAQLAQMKMDPESEPYEDLKEVLQSANRAKSLIQQILAIGCSQEQERQTLQIQDLVRETLKFLRSTLPSTIEIREMYDKEVGIIDADPTQMHQVLMNLCTNAGHAMEEDGGTLTVSLRNVTVGPQESESEVHLEPGRYVKLSVSDTGYGIDPEIRERIFDPYFTTKETGTGTGIGLSVVHGIIEQHGGAISVESEPGKGSTFHVYLPLTQAEEEAPAVKEETPLPTGSERILFIDDEAALANMGKQMLIRLGYDVTSMTSSVEALALFKNGPEQFDLVITDTTMPRMPGDALAQEMMKIRPEIPIIITTGHSKRISAEKAREIGIKGFLMKPLAMRDLADMVRKVLDEK
ncbi:MAG: response regulator [Deltaproteobacteria bacterium]|nr:response regulator [Deltaproteobacteria bacterium]